MFLLTTGALIVLIQQQLVRMQISAAAAEYPWTFDNDLFGGKTKLTF
ncbi:unnamed protein product [Anisakis simplex]|uniref:Transposase n=1 Tax=Anisakis simplex TaxID=6269 RepID=A0A0M3JDJ6_ANISI|nr:unnamed protein product [Anisakis simplex]